MKIYEALFLHQNSPATTHRCIMMYHIGQLDCGHHVADHTECACFPGNIGFSCPSLIAEDFTTGRVFSLHGTAADSVMHRRTELIWEEEALPTPTVLHSLRTNTVTKTVLNLYLIELALVTGYLGVLGDLNHSNPFVRRTLLTWVREMVQNYSALAGLMVVNGG